MLVNGLTGGLRVQRIGTLVIGIALSLSLGLARNSYGLMQIAFDNGADGIVEATVTDNSGGDLSSITGFMIAAYSGGPWVVSVAVGTSKPVAVAPTVMDLNFTALSSGGGSILISLTDTNWSGLGVQQFLAQIGGVMAEAATVEYWIWGSLNNGAFARTNLICSDTLSGSPYAGSCVGLFTQDPQYSLTLDVKVTHVGWGISTGNLEFRVLEPSAMILLGLGLLGLCMWTRKRTFKRKQM